MKVTLDTRITWERPVVTKDTTDQTNVTTWTPVATVWAEVRDDAPGRNEALKGGDIVTAPAQSRVRYRYRTDITADMRGVIVGPVRRELYIISGRPAMIGDKSYSEVKCKELTS